MAVIKNTFSGELDSVTVNAHTITGLTSETSTTNFSYVSPEASLHFLRNLYQTLLDAGYDDTIINEEDYSITVLGFKFFILLIRYNGSISLGIMPYIYTYGSENNLSYAYGGYSAGSSSNYKDHSIVDFNTNTNLQYTITVRGDKNFVCITCGSYRYPNAENPLIYIAKAKNIITGEDMYAYGGILDSATTSGNYHTYKRFRKKDDLYNELSYFDTCPYYNGKAQFSTYYDYAGFQTASKFVIEPVTAYYGSILIPSMIMCNDVYFTKGSYYKINSDLYYCNGYKTGSASYYNCGQYVLYKVSD